jgi:hypothetical protein
MNASHADTLRALVQRESIRLRGISEKEASAPRAPGKWSRKEALGHLVDSALNNHQRFVRAQAVDALAFPGYSQDEWVRSQGYVDEAWLDLVTLWETINRHLAHVVARIPAAKLSVPCRIGSGAVMTLDALVVDYLRHVNHHLEQI